MGLRFPTELPDWQRWQANRHPARRLKALLRPSATAPASAVVASRGDGPARLLVVLESTSATSLYALIEPLRHLADVPVAVAAPIDVTDRLPGDGWRVGPVAPLDLARDLPEVRLVLAAGHYLPLGDDAFRQATPLGIPFVAVQHGLMTPLAPPLPPGGHLLAWSEPDADFWRSGRTDVTSSVVG
ncbi:MAG: hypothetical protein WCF04_03585, partial [Candidatus Nanopelagicales bacterium]